MALEDQQIRSVLEKVLSTETTITDESVIKLRRIMEKFIRVVARLGFERCLINTQDRCIDSDCIKQAIEILALRKINRRPQLCGPVGRFLHTCDKLS